ncbi:MAG TPA: ImmA/IrrE family metallo-endopeptidase [Pseudogracilibacillus sp.]|nr:ImmA/IrrE family metallo-endopeptidase [Pseudogracilibacillus sp.]
MNNTERYIDRLYKKINVNSHEQLSVNHIALFLNIDVVYWKHTSAIANYHNRHTIFINETLGLRRQWQDFGHEMAHFCWHDGSQKHLFQTYLDYQEIKADYFALHFCVPTFMLMELKGVTAYDIMTLFNVEFDFAIRRLEIHKNKMIKTWGGNGNALQTSKK